MDRRGLGLGRVAAAVLILLFQTSVARGGDTAMALATCMNSHMTRENRGQFVRWMFGALAANPDVRPLPTVSDAEYAGVARAFAGTIEDLLTGECRAAAAAAIQSEGQSGLQQAFAALGEIAGAQLFDHPKVRRRIALYATMLNESKLRGLSQSGAEPGISRQSQ